MGRLRESVCELVSSLGTKTNEESSVGERSANSTRRPPVAELAQRPGSGVVLFSGFAQDKDELGEWSRKPQHWIALVSG